MEAGNVKTLTSNLPPFLMLNSMLSLSMLSLCRCYSFDVNFFEVDVPVVDVSYFSQNFHSFSLLYLFVLLSIDLTFCLPISFYLLMLTAKKYLQLCSPLSLLGIIYLCKDPFFSPALAAFTSNQNCLFKQNFVFLTICLTSLCPVLSFSQQLCIFLFLSKYLSVCHLLCHLSL